MPTLTFVADEGVCIVTLGCHPQVYVVFCYAELGPCVMRCSVLPPVELERSSIDPVPGLSAQSDPDVEGGFHIEDFSVCFLVLDHHQVRVVKSAIGKGISPIPWEIDVRVWNIWSVVWNELKQNQVEKVWVHYNNREVHVVLLFAGLISVIKLKKN